MSLPFAVEFLQQVETDPVAALTELQLLFKRLPPQERRAHAPALLEGCARRLWADGVEHLLANWPQGLPIPSTLAATIVHATADAAIAQARTRGEQLATSLITDLEWHRQQWTPADLMALVVGGPHGFLLLPPVFDSAQAYLLDLGHGLALDVLDLAARTPATVHSSVRQMSFRQLARLRQGVLERHLLAPDFSARELAVAARL